MVDEYLAVDAVNALDSAVYLRRLSEFLGAETLSDTFFDSLDEGFTLFLFVFEDMLDLRVCVRIEVVEGEILKLLLYRHDTEAVSDRSVDIHSFKGGITLFVEGAVLESTHIMETVAELDYHNSDVLRHSKKYLADILSLLFLTAEDRYLAQFGDAVNEHGNVLTEAFLEVIKSGWSVLNYVVQEGSADSICVHTELEQYICNSERVYDIVLTGGTLLSLMSLSGEFVSRDYLAQVVLLIVGEYLLDYHFDSEIVLIVRYLTEVFLRICRNSRIRYEELDLIFACIRRFHIIRHKYSP